MELTRDVGGGDQDAGMPDGIALSRLFVQCNNFGQTA
jgi:hypothetical protein